jgi:hypothetical protein
LTNPHWRCDTRSGSTYIAILPKRASADLCPLTIRRALARRGYRTMRLFNTSTILLEEFFSHQLPEYVILSHTWGEDEATLRDMRAECAMKKKGYSKIFGCCRKALGDGSDYCWIETCCIDRTSSAELSEAINSMHQWYERLCICYVYLPDVVRVVDNDTFSTSVANYRDSRQARWFTRGWTLEELIAPAVVEFYDKD